MPQLGRRLRARLRHPAGGRADRVVWRCLAQLPASFNNFAMDQRVFVDGYYRIAWGFLRLKSESGKTHLGRSRVQLYK
eukprot:118923-Prorocentrum_minimum.AAC.2